MRRLILLLMCVVSLPAGTPAPVAAQIERPAIGAGVGVAGGVVVTLSAIVARARFKSEYIDSVNDLIHWQSIPMVAAPIAGVVFGLAGQDALLGSIIGSTSGMVAGAAVGGLAGYIHSGEQEWPWAGGVIGAGVGLTIGGLSLGLARWASDENADIPFPKALRFNVSLPLQ